MSTTINTTLPNDWDASISYSVKQEVYYNNVIYQSLVNSNLNHNPALSPDYWKALDIYKKELTVMPHGDYSGDDSFWERDNIYIDTDGYVYVNNENTGINVNGRTTVDVNWDNLTPAQREQLKGEQGERGLTGATGPQGPQGPMGQVEWSSSITPEQYEQLRGPEGKSTYQIWLDLGHTGTEVDFLCWLQSNIIHIDDVLDTTSTNPVQNKVIALALNTYMIQVNDLLRQYQARIQDLEDRLKATYNGDEYTFRYGITEGGKHGYRINNSDVVIPFDSTSDVLSSLAAFPLGGIALSAFGQRAEQAAQTIVNQNRLGIGSASITGNPSSGATPTLNGELDSEPNEVVVQSFNNFFYNNEQGYIYRNNHFEDGVAYDLEDMTYDETNGLNGDGIDDLQGIIIPYETVSERNTGYINIEVESESLKYIIGYISSSYGRTDFNLAEIVTRGTYHTGTVSNRTRIILPTPNSNVFIYFSKYNDLNTFPFKIHSIYFTSEQPEEE